VTAAAREYTYFASNLWKPSEAEGFVRTLPALHTVWDPKHWPPSYSSKEGGRQTLGEKRRGRALWNELGGTLVEPWVGKP
jgi:hypothetical protein